jgi:glucose/arabinose dehydrogenase
VIQRPDSVRSLRAQALTVAVTFLVFAAACGADQPGSAPKLVSIGAGLHGPAGLTATVSARGLPKVSAFAYDGQARLWAATADSTDRGKDAVYLVRSAGQTPVRVIAGVHTPLGMLWYGDQLYVASAGRVDAYRGFDGAKFARHRTILTLPSDTGEFNGIVLEPDGRMAMGISAPCDHCTPTSKWSASVVSFRPDGTDLQVYASGIRAPVGLVVHPRTKELFVTMNQRDDLGARTRGDWLATVRRGQSFGFPSCYGQGGAACAGVPQPTAVLDKHAAVSGVAIVTGQLGPAVGTSALVAEWATGKVQAVALPKSTATSPAGTVHPFLTGLKNPVPVIRAPDGAILVGDWTQGIVYRIARHA